MKKIGLRILDPIADYPTIDLIPLSQRLKDLNGKTVYLIVVLTMPMSCRDMQEIGNRLNKYYPDINIVYREKQFGPDVDEPDLWKEVYDNANSVIVGTADTGGFAASCVEWAAMFERRGIPSVVICDREFKNSVKIPAKIEGIPSLRIAYKNHMKPIMDETIKEVVKGLTDPLNDIEKKNGKYNVRDKTPRYIIEVQDEKDLSVKYGVSQVQEYFNNHQMTDGLPIIKPTDNIVEKFLSYTSHSPNEIIGIMKPFNLEIKVEKVIINGVMAGCKPNSTPLLLAMAEALVNSGMLEAARATTSWAYPIIVNGPVAEEIGMNSGINALGPGNPANATIGRALNLFKCNLAGLKPGINDMSCIGNPLKYCFCCAENEKNSPWNPLHVDLGFKANESTVTIFLGGRSFKSIGAGYGNCIDRGLQEPEATLVEMSKQIKGGMHPFASLHILDPSVAKLLTEYGFDKKSLRQWLWENTKVTMAEFKQSWGYKMFIPATIRKGSKPGRPVWPKEYLDLGDDVEVNLLPSQESIFIVVVGGSSNPDYNYYDIGGASHEVICSTASVDKWR